MNISAQTNDRILIFFERFALKNSTKNRMNRFGVTRPHGFSVPKMKNKNRIFQQRATETIKNFGQKRVFKDKKVAHLKALKTGYLPIYLSRFRKNWEKLTFLRGGLKQEKI